MARRGMQAAAMRLGVQGREALAVARQAVLLPRDLGTSFSRAPAPGDDVVVFVHGLFATAGVLRPLRDAVEAATGACTASFSYAPGRSVPGLAARLAALVQGVPASATVHLVGHSLGGVVVRWFVQELGGASHVAQTIALASPFNGTRHARFLPGPAGRAIEPGSPTLVRLRAGAPATSALPHLSVIAEHDTVITEWAAAPVGEVLVVPGVGHNGLLYRPEVASVVAERVARHARGSSVAAE